MLSASLNVLFYVASNSAFAVSTNQTMQDSHGIKVSINVCINIHFEY